MWAAIICAPWQIRVPAVKQGSATEIPARQLASTKIERAQGSRPTCAHMGTAAHGQARGRNWRINSVLKENL